MSATAKFAPLMLSAPKAVVAVNGAAVALVTELAVVMEAVTVVGAARKSGFQCATNAKEDTRNVFLFFYKQIL